MAITTYDGLVAGLAASKSYVIAKASISTQGAGGYTSLWRGTGQPEQGAIPTVTGTSVYSTLAGSMGPLTVGSGLTGYIANLALVGSISHQFIVYDRLMHLGGLSGAASGATALVDCTVSTLSYVQDGSRCSLDEPCLEWWLDIYADIGTTARVITFTYTGPSASGQTCTLSYGGSSPLNQDSRSFRILPTTEGSAIVSIQTFSPAATTGAAGSWGITARRKLTQVNMGQPNVGVDKDFAGIGMPRVGNNACIEYMVLSSTTSSGVIDGWVNVIQG
jgi:hypothetical protein